MVAGARAKGTYDDVSVADASALPFADDSFALVAAFMTLHDIDDLDGALGEVARVLRPDGALVAALPHPVSSAHLGSPEPAPYFESRRYAWEHERDGRPITFHSVHRSLETVFAKLGGAGLVVTELREPVPSPTIVAAYPEMAKSLRRPSFLLLAARLA